MLSENIKQVTNTLAFRYEVEEYHKTWSHSGPKFTRSSVGAINQCEARVINISDEENYSALVLS